METLLRDAQAIIRRLSDALDERRDVVPAPRIIGSLTLNRAAFNVCWKSEPVHLSTNQFKVVDYLASYPEFTRDLWSIIDHASNVEKDVLERSACSIIKNIRKSFKEIDAGFNAIRTIRGQGYLWREDSPEN